MTKPPALASASPRLVGSLVIGLNILRRQIGAYPAGHPAVAAAAEKVIRLLRHILRETETLTLTFSRETVMWGLIPLDRGNPVFHDYARALSSRGVAGITFSTATSPDDILRLNRVLSLRKEEIYSGGGVNALLQKEAPLGLDIQEVDYRQFRLVEGEREIDRSEAASLWERLIIAMFADGDAAMTAQLAANLNNYLEENPAKRSETYASVVTAFIRSMDADAADGGTADFAQKLAALTTGLAPEIRNQFLASAFDLLPEKSAAAEAFFLALPHEVIVAAVDEINQESRGIPPVMLGLLNRLGSTANKEAATRPGGEQSAAEMAAKVRVLLRPEKFHHFVPDVYQGKLDMLLAGDSVSGVSLEEAAGLRELFYAENPAIKTAAIMAEVVRNFPSDYAALAEPVEELCHHLLEAGDLSTLLDVCLTIRGAEEEHSARLLLDSVPQALVGAVGSLGKERQGELKELLRIVGEPCIDPLLDRLAEENSMALRRYLIDCVTAIGPAARPKVLSRLDDGRWYVVRNLLVILRHYNDRADIPRIRPLLRHANDKVKIEALRTLLALRDREAEKSLAAEIQRGTRTIQLSAIQMAERSRSPEVIDALLRVAEKSGLKTDLEVRKLAVRILGTTGDMRALPVLDRLLQTRSLLWSSNTDALKLDIVRSLPSYPEKAAAQLLGKIAATGQGELARTAASLLATLREKTV